MNCGGLFDDYSTVNLLLTFVEYASDKIFKIHEYLAKLPARRLIVSLALCTVLLKERTQQRSYVQRMLSTVGTLVSQLILTLVLTNIKLM